MSQTISSLRRELAIALLTICCAILVLPGLIYLVGSQIFGAYGETGGIANLYQATLSDLMVPRLAAWTLVLGPALCIVLLRLVLRFTSSDQPVAQSAQRKRREPTFHS